MLMETRFLSEELAVSPQLDASGLEAAIAAGFKTIICNRPDNEPGAVAFESLKSIPEAANIPFIYQPVVSGALTDDDARQFAEIFQAAEKPVLAYCRSGARCTELYVMALAHLA